MFWNIALCLCSLVYMSTGLTILPMKDGLLVKRNLPVRIKVSEWRATLTVDDPSDKVITAVFRETTLFRRLVESIPATLGKGTRKGYWIREVDRAEGWLRTLIPRRTRERRALLGIIGKLSHDLFGTATAEQVEELTEKVMENRDSLQKVVHFDEELLSIVNITHEEMISNRETINEILNVTDYMQHQFITLMKTTEWTLHALQTYNLIREKMDLIWKHIQEIQRILDEYGFIKHALEEGRLDEYLLPKILLNQILRRHKMPGAGMIVPNEWYYTNSRVLPIWGEDFLAFVVYLPLVENRQHEGFRITTYPVPLLNSSNTVRMQADGLVAIGATGDVLHLQQCVGMDPIVCDPSPVRKDMSTTYSCAQAVIMRDERLQEKCPALIESHPEGLIFKEVPNHIILVSWGEEITEQCKGHVQRVQVDPGTYQVEWQGQCFLTTAHWSVAGVHTSDVNRTINLGWDSWDIPDFSLPKAIGHLNTSLRLPQRLPSPMTIRLHPPTVPTMFTIKARRYYYYYLPLLILLPFIIIAYFIYKHKCLCLMKKEQANRAGSIEMVGMENVDVPRPFRLQVRAPTVEDN